GRDLARVPKELGGCDVLLCRLAGHVGAVAAPAKALDERDALPVVGGRPRRSLSGSRARAQHDQVEVVVRHPRSQSRKRRPRYTVWPSCSHVRGLTPDRASVTARLSRGLSCVHEAERKRAAALEAAGGRALVVESAPN